MIISLNWLKDFLSIDATAQEIADRLSVSGLEVEHIENWNSVAGGLKGFVIGKVITCEQHPNADRLKVTTVDIGSGELQPIVCGAPNVAAGQKVVVATVGTLVNVPGKGEFVIGEAMLRGEKSHGMICAEDEAGLGTSHDGIMILPEDAPVGMPAAEYFGNVSDTLLEIGLTANRGDAASHLGVARDIAALFDISVQQPEIKDLKPAQGSREILVPDPQLCKRYVALQLNGVKNIASPAWMQNRLKAIGIEPRNILVDATNYVLHELGQPTHVFDADKLAGNAISVRQAAKGEKLTTLDKTERELHGHELLIADANGPIALAGVMGGNDSAVGQSTVNILIESASFHAATVRKSARAHVLNTDASFRFERGTDVEICAKAAYRVADLIMQHAGGAVAGINEYYPQPFEPIKVQLNIDKLNHFAGAAVQAEEAESILQKLGFGVTKTGALDFEVTVPAYRNDVSVAVDLYEEILRIYGYDNIPMPGKMAASLPAFKGYGLHKNSQRSRNYLNAQGFYEVATNSLAPAAWYGNANNLVEITNPLSTDLQYMRASLLPGMLQSAAYNRNRRAHNVHFYEFGRVYAKQNNGFDEKDMLGILVGGNSTEESWEQKQKPADFYFLKQICQGVAANIAQRNSLFSIQQVGKELLQQFDLTGDWWYAEAEWANFETVAVKAAEPAKYPWMRRDLSLVVNRSTAFSEINAIIESNAGKLIQKTVVFDIFEGKPLEEGKKAIAIAFYLGATDHTLTDKDADEVMSKLMKDFETKVQAVIRK